MWCEDFMRSECGMYGQYRVGEVWSVEVRSGSKRVVNFP